MLRISTAIMAILFFFWAGFQYNDPDGWLWMVIYGVAGAATVLGFFERLPSGLAMALCLAATLGGAFLAYQVIVGGLFFFSEMGREMIGLFIIAVWMGWLGAQMTAQLNRKTPSV